VALDKKKSIKADVCYLDHEVVIRSHTLSDDILTYVSVGLSKYVIFTGAPLHCSLNNTLAVSNYTGINIFGYLSSGSTL